MPKSMFRLESALIVIAAACLGVAPADAKCPFVKYTVRGRLQVPQGVDAESLRIVLFLEGASNASAYPPSSGESDFVVPNDEGFFTISSYASSASALGCQGIKRSGDLIVLGLGVRSLRTGVKFPDSGREILRALTVDSELPPLRLERIED